MRTIRKFWPATLIIAAILAITGGIAIASGPGNLVVQTHSGAHVRAPACTTGELWVCDSTAQLGGDFATSMGAGLTVTGGAVNLNASSNYAVNAATGTSTGTVTIGSGTGAQSVVVQSGTGDLSLQSTDDLNICTTASACDVAIGNATGATSVRVTSGTGGVELESTGTGDVTLDPSDDLLVTVGDDYTVTMESAGGIFDLNGTGGVVANLFNDDTVADSIAFASAKDTTTVAGAAVFSGSVLANDDVLVKFGTGSDASLEFDAARAAFVLDRAGAKFAGFDGLADRLELKWVGGARGLPQLNAVTDPPAGDTYNTVAMTALLNADREFEVLGTNASSDDVTLSAEGGVLVETDGADGDEVILLPHLNAGQSAWSTVTWGTDRTTTWEAYVSTRASITNTIVWAGLKLTSTEVTATDADQVFFRFEDDVNGGEWQAVASIGGADVETDTNVAVATSTPYHLMIKIASDRTAKFFINGALVYTSAALTDATDLIPYIGVAADGAAAAKSLVIYGQAASRTY